MPRLISGINFHFHFVNQIHLFMLTYYYYDYKCQDLSDAIATVAGALYIVYQ